MKGILFLIAAILSTAVAGPLQGTASATLQCVIHVKGQTVDLMAMGKTDHVVKTSSNNTTLLSLCVGLADKDCRGAMMCTKNGAAKEIILPHANVNKVESDSSGVKLTYHGLDCPSGGKHQVIIKLICSQTKGEPIEEESKSCLTTLSWQTPAACLAKKVPNSSVKPEISDVTDLPKVTDTNKITTNNAKEVDENSSSTPTKSTPTSVKDVSENDRISSSTPENNEIHNYTETIIYGAIKDPHVVGPAMIGGIVAGSILVIAVLIIVIRRRLRNRCHYV